MKKYTTAMGTNCSYLVHDGFHIAKSVGTSREDNDQLNAIAADLNELALLRESQKELARLMPSLSKLLEGRAQAITSATKPHSGDSQAKEGATS